MIWSLMESNPGSFRKKMSNLILLVWTLWECFKIAPVLSWLMDREKELSWIKSKLLWNLSQIGCLRKVAPVWMRTWWTTQWVMEPIELQKQSQHSQVTERKVGKTNWKKWISNMTKTRRLRGKRTQKRALEMSSFSQVEPWWKYCEIRPCKNLLWPLLTSQTWWLALKSHLCKNKNCWKLLNLILERENMLPLLLPPQRINLWPMKQIS